MTTVTETIPFDFSDIYDFVEEKFEDEGYDKQEGSSTMQLVTAMSYLVSMLNANTATNINETLLTVARKRSVMLQDARVLGYEVSHIQSYQYTLSLLFTNDTDDVITETIDKYTKFSAGDKSYYYLGDTLSINVPANSTITTTITVKEGTLYLYENEQTLTIILTTTYDEYSEEWAIQTYVDVPFTDVEKDGIEMFVKFYDDDGYLQYEQWEQSTQFMIDADTSLASNYVRLNDIDYGTPRLYFKIGDVGNDMRTGTIIEMNIITSSGSEGIMSSLPTCDSINAEITNYELSIAGADEEDRESIRVNAPLFHNTANRCVTKYDYNVYCNRQTSIIKSNIWDGNDEYPRVAGNIWFSFIPSTVTRELNDDANPGYQWDLQNLTNYSNWYLEEDEIADVFESLQDYSIPTISNIHRNPIYMDFNFNINIAKYVIQTSVSDIHEQVYNKINDFFRDETVSGDDSDAESVENFEYEYFQSNLIKRIDTELTDNTGFDVELTTNINISEKNIISEQELSNVYYKEIRFILGSPYEDVFNDYIIVFDNLPDITTSNLFDSEIGDANYNRTLYIDESTFSLNKTENITTYSIKLTESDSEQNVADDVIGIYRIFNKNDRYIEVILYVTDINTSTSVYTTGIDLSHLEVPNVDDGEMHGVFIDVKYPSSNIKLSRNTIPRLKQVIFN